MNTIAHYLDLANHHADATTADIEKLCKTVRTYGFNSAFVNPLHVALARTLIGADGKVGTAISFPLGQDRNDIKIASSLKAISDGADELDIVPNNALLLETNGGALYQRELTEIVSAIRKEKQQTIIKFIIETGLFDALPHAKTIVQTAAMAIKESGADFVKFGTGMGKRGASLEDLRIVKDTVRDTIRIKVAGGIDTYEEALSFITAGASRIGTSKAVLIVTQNKSTL